MTSICILLSNSELLNSAPFGVSGLPPGPLSLNSGTPASSHILGGLPPTLVILLSCAFPSACARTRAIERIGQKITGSKAGSWHTSPSAPAHADLLDVRFVDRDSILLANRLARRHAGREVIQLLSDLLGLLDRLLAEDDRLVRDVALGFARVRLPLCLRVRNTRRAD